MEAQQINDDGLNTACDMAKEAEGILRCPEGFSRFISPTIAIAWSLFQLSVASFWVLNSTFTRAIHLGFAMLIIFLNYPMLKTPLGKLEFLSTRKKIPCLDIALAASACLAALYLPLNYHNIVERLGAPTGKDIIVGIVLILLLIEGARRVIGPALPIIASTFILYAFFGAYMPDLIAFKGVSMSRFISQMTMSTEGVYGVPLHVSATIVFLFVLFGSMLEKAGAGKYFIQLALSLLGGFRGGPAKAAVLGSGLTGMVSGSSVANVVTTGTFTIPLMKQVGYPAKKAAAIEVAASTNGQLMPPIMGAAAFIIAEYVNVPYVEVIKAAAIPAFASYFSLFYITHLEACKLGLSGIPREELPPFFKTLISGAHYLIPLVTLLYELVILRHTPESAAFNAIWMMAVVMLLQHPVRAYFNRTCVYAGVKQGIVEIFSALASGGRNMVTVAVATATAGIVVGIVAMGLGQLVTTIIDSLSGGNIYIMLGLTALISLVLGMGLPTTANYIVMASLTAPAIVTIGGMNDFVVPLMAAHLYCLYFGILADDTPPVGLAAYAAAAIAKAPAVPTGIQGFTYDIRTAILPLMFIFNSDIILNDIHSWSVGLLIFGMTCLGSFAFAAATQGWFITRNKIYEFPLFLMICLVFMRPDLVAGWVGIPHELRHLSYLIGLLLYGVAYAWQKNRCRREVVFATPASW